MVYDIILERLFHYRSFDSLAWNETTITLHDVENARSQEESEFPRQPYQYQPHIRLESDRWHIGRILYFVENPSAITPISIDNYCNCGVIYPEPIIDDGHHRLMAAIILKYKTIRATYGGRVDVLNYLIGKRRKIVQA